MQTEISITMIDSIQPITFYKTACPFYREHGRLQQKRKPLLLYLIIYIRYILFVSLSSPLLVGSTRIGYLSGPIDIGYNLSLFLQFLHLGRLARTTCMFVEAVIVPSQMHR